MAILQFHGAPDTAHAWVNTPRENFEAFMNYLGVHKYRVVALRDLSEYVDPEIVPADPQAVIQRRNKRVGVG